MIEYYLIFYFMLIVITFINTVVYDVTLLPTIGGGQSGRLSNQTELTKEEVTIYEK